jgi:hypothetical protein
VERGPEGGAVVVRSTVKVASAPLDESCVEQIVKGITLPPLAPGTYGSHVQVLVATRLSADTLRTMRDAVRTDVRELCRLLDEEAAAAPKEADRWMTRAAERAVKAARLARTREVFWHVAKIEQRAAPEWAAIAGRELGMLDICPGSTAWQQIKEPCVQWNGTPAP